MANPLSTISEMCKTYCVTDRALRYYESKELLSPFRQGQRRLYDKRNRARLKLVLRGKRFGITLEEIRQILDLYDLDDQMQTQIERSCELGEKRLAAMKKQKQKLRASILELQAMPERGLEHISQLRHTDAEKRISPKEI